MPIDQSTGSEGNFQQIEDKAREAGTRVFDAAKDRARSLFEEQQLRAADQVGSVARALHQAASQLNDENASSYVSRAADQVDRFADTLRSHDLDDLIDRTERFARRQPELFIGGALLLGLAFGRFLKASGDRRRGDGTADGDYDDVLEGERQARRMPGRTAFAGANRPRPTEPGRTSEESDL